MWSLGPHCRSLLHGYRFVDPQWEADFQTRSQTWALSYVRCYVVVAFLVSCTGLAEFRRYFAVRPSLILHTLICGGMPILLLGTFCCRSVRQAVVPVLAATCCAVALSYCFILADNIELWIQHALAHYVPALMDLAEDDTARRQAETMLRRQVATEAVYVALMWSFNHWMALAGVGLRPYTVASFVTVHVSLSLTLVLNHGIAFATSMETIGILSITTGGFLAMGIVLERLRRTNFLNEALLTRELQASQMADSMLNHTLKNLLADVAANIEVFLAGSGPRGTLEDSVTRLRRGMVACKERQVYLKLVSGEYIPVFQEVSLQEFGHQLAAGRNVRVQAVDLSVHLDSTICGLILENALSNAFRHGYADDPQVALVIDAPSTQHSRQGFQRIRFMVENAVDPHRPPLTPEDAARLFQGQAHLVSNVRVPTLSDRVGIVHCVMAAQVGGVTLSLAQAGHTVRFTAELDVLVVPRPASRSFHAWSDDSSSSLIEFPSGLRYCCLDDSASALRLLELHIRTWCAPSKVHLLGHSEEDVHGFVPFALHNADIVILDQHLEFSKTYYGTDLVQHLCEQRFGGLLCIRSANDSEEDRERFRQAGAHCCFGKDMAGSRMMEELKAAFIRLMGTTSTVVLSPHIHTEGASSTSTLLPGNGASNGWPPTSPFPPS
eukprot:EG_transcript_5246